MMKKVNLFAVVLAVLTAVAATRSDAQCTFTLDSLTAHFTTAGGSSNVDVTASDPSCSWQAISYSPFVTITSTQDFTGNGTVSYTVTDNTNLVGFTSTLVIAGQTYLIVQDAFFVSHGTYYGVAVPTNAPSQTGSGPIKLKLSTGGTFTSTLMLGGVATTFKGRFDGAGNYSTNSLSRPKLSPLQLSLQLDLFNGADAITGMVSDGSVTSAVFAAVSASDRTNHCPVEGQYTFVLAPANTNDTTVPQGYGYGLLTVRRNGSASMQGMLGDGTMIRGNLPVSLDDTWPLYNPLYKKNLGSCIGLVLLATNTGFDTGVDWIKPAQATDHLYPTGFVTSVTLTGATFVSGFVPIGSNTVTLGGGNLVSNLVKTVSIDSNAVVTVLDPGSDRLTLAFFPSSGFFNGSFVDPAAGKMRQFAGQLVDTNHFGAGTFLGTTQSGFVVLQPVP